MAKKRTRIEVPLLAGIAAYAIVVDGEVTELEFSVGQLDVDELEADNTLSGATAAKKPVIQEAIEAARDAVYGSDFTFTEKL